MYEGNKADVCDIKNKLADESISISLILGGQTATAKQLVSFLFPDRY